MDTLDFLFLLGRALYGGFFVITGFGHFTKKSALVGYAKSKGVAAAEMAVVVSGLMILLGGLGVLLGVLVEWALALIVLFLLAVTLRMHAFWGIQDPQAKMMEIIQFQKNMALMGAGLMLLGLTAPWAYSLSF